MKEGEFVIDRAEGDKMILMSKHSVPSDEWVLKEKDPSKNRYSEQTVWDFNSRYAFCEPSDPVCKCVYLGYAPFEPLGLSRLERANKLQEMDTEDIEYAFPITRIKPDKK